MTVLKVDVRVGETIRFSGHGNIAILIKAKSGRISRLEINADPSINIETPKHVSVRDVVKEGVIKGPT